MLGSCKLTPFQYLRDPVGRVYKSTKANFHKINVFFYKSTTRFLQLTGSCLKKCSFFIFKSSTIHRDLGLWPSNTLHSLSSPLLAIFISIHQYFKLACIIKCKVKKINHWTSYPKLLMNALITDKQILLCNTIFN